VIFPLRLLSHQLVRITAYLTNQHLKLSLQIYSVQSVTLTSTESVELPPFLNMLPVLPQIISLHYNKGKGYYLGG
jgi:hypothetical protein